MVILLEYLNLCLIPCTLRILPKGQLIGIVLPGNCFCDPNWDGMDLDGLYSLRPVDAYMRQWVRPSMDQIMFFACLAPSYYLNLCWHIVNYANPVYGVATICHQVRWLRWGHPSLFRTATSLLIWYQIFCVRYISYRLIWMEFINMFSVYAQSGTHRCFNW